MPVILEDGLRRNVWGNGLAYAVDTSGNPLVYHTDGLGSVRALTDVSGTVAQSYQYDEYGNVLSSSGSITQPFQYTGEQRDETGLLYLRARMYDPGAGRFVARDVYGGALSTPTTLNRFTYVLNRATNLVDPSGFGPTQRVLRWEDPQPDYVAYTLNVAVPNPLTQTWVGWSGVRVIDRYGREYTSYQGATAGKSLTGISGSFTWGWLNQIDVPTPGELVSFLEGHSVNAGGGFFGGYQATLSPGAENTKLAHEFGAFTPQAGVSYHYTDCDPATVPPDWLPWMLR